MKCPESMFYIPFQCTVYYNGFIDKSLVSGDWLEIIEILRGDKEQFFMLFH